MKMSYQSGDKKNILGHRLSNRYLSSDAFTSSAGKTSGRSISRLGSMFKGHKSGRRYSGTGQKVSLFELKNIALKLIFIITCVLVLSYVVPFMRYGIHSFFAQKSATYNEFKNPKNADDLLATNEYYVAPLFLQTDRYGVARNATAQIENGSLVYVSPMNTLVGILETTASSSARMVLFSSVGFKNSFFFKNSAVVNGVLENQSVENEEDTVIVDENATTSSSTKPTSIRVQNVIVPDYTSIVFEGLGYGQMLAKVPPQVTIEVGTVIYTRTSNGLQPVGKVSFVEVDNGSTFTNIYAQILTPPYAIYKVRVAEPI